jgi:hypothetical protein
MNLVGNLDCEARWAGVALPEAVQRRISLYAALFAACAPDDGPGDRGPEDRSCGEDRDDGADRGSEDHGRGGDRDDRGAAPHQLWVPARVDPARLLAQPGWTPPRILTGDPPPRVDLAWADPAARDANDRSRTLAIAQTLGVALPGARMIASLAELDDHLVGFAARPWICKARWTAAGRDRIRGAGAPAGELRVRIGRMIERFGPLVFEPWLDRVTDIGVCGTIAAGGAVTVLEPHRLITDPRGGFLGIELAAVDPAIAGAVQAVARQAARLLADQTGYRGPFAIDAFAYRDPDGQKLHPLCELNARHSFGWIAHGLARRLGIRRLGFDAPPHGATVLIAPGADRVTAWCA